MTKLQTLSLGVTDISDEGDRALRRALPATVIDHVNRAAVERQWIECG